MFLLLFMYAPQFVAVTTVLAADAADVSVGDISLEVSIEIVECAQVCRCVDL